MSAQKPPVAIRITRPYESEDEFLANELDTISRTGVTLVGAQPRPEGVVLRFELALASGAPLLRGEGRVIGYKAVAFGSEPGLSLRFTRLDSKSKALVDRVGVARETRRSSLPPPPPSARPPKVEPPVPAASDNSIPITVDSSELLVSTGSNPALILPQPAGPALAVTDRGGMLARLRKRAVDITPDTVQGILADGAARRRR